MRGDATSGQSRQRERHVAQRGLVTRVKGAVDVRARGEAHVVAAADGCRGPVSADLDSVAVDPQRGPGDGERDVVGLAVLEAGRRRRHDRGRAGGADHQRVDPGDAGRDDDGQPDLGLSGGRSQVEHFPLRRAAGRVVTTASRVNAEPGWMVWPVRSAGCAGQPGL